MRGIGKGEAAGVAQHVRMGLEREARRAARTIDQLGEAGGGASGLPLADLCRSECRAGSTPLRWLAGRLSN
jgi:hypothetical protein